MKYFPKNTTTNFFTKLPKSIKLNGEWKVGIAEFQYPCTIYSVQNTENYVRIIERKPVVIDGIESGFYDDIITANILPSNYDTIEDILMLINEHTLLKNKINFIFNLNSKYVQFQRLSDQIIEIELAAKLALQLGFDPNDKIILKNTGTHQANIKLGLPSQMFIYCDIINPQIVGDVMAPLLRVVSLDTSKYIFGVNRMVIFPQPYYIPVMRREFDTLEIDIRSDTGKLIPFQFGITCVKLHFKRITK